MTKLKAHTLNHEIYTKSYKRLKLTATQRMVYQRLLGFLIRNNKAFPYSATSLAEITGLSLRTIFNVLNVLEHYRLIKRVGLGKGRRFMRGSIFTKIMSIAENKINGVVNKIKSTVQLATQNIVNRAKAAFSKTSFSSKRKDPKYRPKDHGHCPKYQEYVSRLKALMTLEPTKSYGAILSLEEFKVSALYNNK